MEDFKVGTVLFNAGDKQNALDWDDSELIEHWDKTVEAYRNKYSKEKEIKQVPYSNKIQKKHNLKNKSSTLNRKSIPDKMPFYHENVSKNEDVKNETNIPTSFQNSTMSNEGDLSNLMMAWYYCGYYTGLYQAQQTSSKNEHT
ncbi:uncharacterized protein BX663DRAFT_507713 [Cokeromyces recurvatus]|uniref:uncharacterized protein n=1 Tax=Cokeromyces recurvatus TaxID=90255 RepID=UPI00221F7D9F|nr:uncharacterized protein BX663DRAFT_507713 [Cokeromyces recurvatus]KAI7903174.1 hypothetical protein BX663DRAFT_507713 [Cokeromyces recurvatus]